MPARLAQSVEVRLATPTVPREFPALQRFRELLPKGVVMYGVEPGTDHSAALLGAERADLDAASAGRMREFSAGRYCAQRAAEGLGMTTGIIRQRADGRAQWPDSLTGSITHSEGLAFAALARRQHLRAIGIDVEYVGRLTPGLWRLVLVAAELEHVERQSSESRARVATVIFSAKEAFYKCQYEVTQRWMEFRDVKVDLHSVDLQYGYCAIRHARDGDMGCGVEPSLVSFAISADVVMSAMVIPAS